MISGPGSAVRTAHDGGYKAPLHRFELHITGMVCASCAVRIERRLNKTDDVRVSVNYVTETATVESGTHTEDDVIALIDGIGFTATPKQLVDPTQRTATELKSWTHRFVAAAMVCGALVILSATPPVESTNARVLLATAAAIGITWCARGVYHSVWGALRRRNYSMDSLIAVSMGCATVWGTAALITTGSPRRLTVAAGMCVFVLAGRTLHIYAKAAARNAITELQSNSDLHLRILVGGDDHLTIRFCELKDGHTVITGPQERVVVGGLVVSGSATIDTSALTGEIGTIRVGVGDRVTPGMLVTDGVIGVEAAGTSGPPAVSITSPLLRQSAPTAIETFSTTVSRIFVPTIAILAAATLAGWYVAGQPLANAAAAALAVLIVACPCAVGLAIPTALIAAGGRGARIGVMFAGKRAHETVRDIDVVVFDKTGTVTIGEMNLVEITGGDNDSDTLIAYASAVEIGSNHPISAALARAAHFDATATGTQALNRGGVAGYVDGHHIRVGHPAIFSHVTDELLEARARAERQGHTVVYIEVDGEVRAAAAFADTLNSTAAAAITQLHKRGVRTVLATGDNCFTAHAVGDRLNIDEVIAELRPEGKVDIVEQLHAQGHRVAVIGDGLNDVPAMRRADLAITFAGQPDDVTNAADLVVGGRNLMHLPAAMSLATNTMGIIKQNMWWAMCYNLIAIPLAAAGIVGPLTAAFAMGTSSLLVVANSLRLARMNLGG